MALSATLDTLYLCWLCKPKSERALFRLVRRRQLRSIVELGIVSTERSLRLIRMARRHASGEEVHYCGIDLFEARPGDQARLTLKQFHRDLAGQGIGVRLVPGDAFSALSRSANQLQNTQLLLISPDHDSEALRQAWMYVPRMLGATATVWQATRGETGLLYRQLSSQDIQTLSQSANRPRRAA